MKRVLLVASFAMIVLAPFVVSRALMGVVRAAVLEEQPFLAGRAFEDEIVRMIVAYLGAVTAAAGRQS